MQDVEKQVANLSLAYSNGNYGDVILLGREISASEPASYACWRLMGAAAQQLGRHQEAIEFFEKALSLDSRRAEAHNNLGVALRASGRLNEAVRCYKTAVSLRADYIEAESNLGSALVATGELRAAVELLRSLVLRHPTSFEACNNLGIALYRLKKFDEAERLFKQALKLAPDRPEVLVNLGNSLRDADKEHEAIDLFEKAITLRPDFADAYFNKAVTLRKLGKPLSAITSYEAGLSYNPRSAAAYRNLANAKRDVGDFAAAVSAYQKSLKLNSQQPDILRNLASMTAFPLTEGFVYRVLEMWESKDRTDAERCSLGFALYSSYCRLGDYRVALKYLQIGNQLRKKEINYSTENDLQLFARLRLIADSLSESSPCLASLNKNKPIFIIGMPRSGTTLLEQILSSHTEIAGMGELPYVHRALSRPLVSQDSISESISKLKSVYAEGLSYRSPTSKWFTDKTPLNFLYLPIIRAAFPEAKFIHIYRDPAATCWSIYEQYFVTRGMGFCYSLDDIALFYESYCSLMHKYSELFGSALYHLSYEKLVIDSYCEIKTLMEYLEVPFQEQLLKHHENSIGVATASSEQVRRPIYANSSKRWKQFSQLIGGRWQTLEPFLPD